MNLNTWLEDFGEEEAECEVSADDPSGPASAAGGIAVPTAPAVQQPLSSTGLALSPQPAAFAVAAGAAEPSSFVPAAPPVRVRAGAGLGQSVPVLQAPWASRTWGMIRERVSLSPRQPVPPMTLDQWLSAPAVSGQGSLSSTADVGGPAKAGKLDVGRRFTADVSFLSGRALETSAGRWVSQGWDQFSRERANLLAKGGERCRDVARASVADVAAKLLPRLEGLKADNVICSDGEAATENWGSQMKGYVKSVIHDKSVEAIYGACRRAGVDTDKLQEGGGSPASSKEAISVVPADKYVTSRTIREALAGGDTVLIKGSWLLKHRKGAPLPSRQQLEAKCRNAAIWKVDELMELADAGDVAIIAVSHGWLSEDHPDPQGEQADILWGTLKHFLDSTSLHDAALFIDWCSLHQKPRSEDEEAAFARAMLNFHVWYAHQGVRVWMLTSVPAGAELCTPYSGRGWSKLERSLSEMVTKTSFLLDLGSLNDKCIDWGHSVATCKPQRWPPLTPEAFADELSALFFIEGADDREVVQQTYARAFLEVIAAAEELAFNELGWGDKEAETLALALSRCRRLRKLTLYGNRIGEVGAAALVQVLSRLGSLQELWLTGNPVARNKDSKAKLINAWTQAELTVDSLHL